MSFKITVDQKKLAEKKAAEAEANRKAAYIAEADPLFFRAQRGEIAEQEWLDKVAEIKARYPKE
jgi:predicted NBD/HSP70 family sugar kinase